MSGLFNPYALTALGKPLQQRQSPELRVETPYITRAQLDMAQHTFVRFLDQARLSMVPNPTQQGRLADGTPYRIVTASGAPIMQVWPVEVDENRVRPKSRHGILLHYFDEVSKFIIVQYFGGEWKSIDVKSGRCGATIHTSAIEDVEGGKLFALTNYGSYDGLVQTETKFRPTGVSDPYPSGVGTSIFSNAVVDCELPGVPVILNEGSVAFVTKTDNEASPVSLYILRIPRNKPSAGNDLPNIQLPDTPADTAEYADRDDIFYGSLSASSKNRSVVARIHSTGIQYAPRDVVTTGFCRRLFDRTPKSIPSHRLSGVPYKYDREVVFNIIKGDDGYELVHSINDISQELRVVDMSSTFEVVDEYIDYPADWTADYYEGRGMHYPEDLYSESGMCKGEISHDYSECRVPLPVNFYLECGSSWEKTSVLNKSASYAGDIFISSYFDFSGNRKELKMSQKINCSSESKRYYRKVMVDPPRTGYPGAPTTAYDIYLTMKSDGSSGWWKELLTRDATTEVKYTSTLNVGDGDIEVVSIDGWVKNNYPSVLSSYGEHAGPADTVTFEFAASVLNTLSFDGLTEILTGVRVDARSGGEKEAPVRRIHDDVVYFDATLGFTSYFEVYHRGILVFSRILDTYEQLISLTSSSSIPPYNPKPEYLKELTRSKSPTYIDTWKYSVEFQEGVCAPVKFTPERRTIKIGERGQSLGKYEGELKTSDTVFLNISMFPTSDVTQQFTSDPNISKLAPPKTMIAIDPTSGGCAVVNDVCKILISPEGKVTEIQSVTGIPDNSLKSWCTST